MHWSRRPGLPARCSTTSCSTGSAPTPTSTAAARTPTAAPTRWPGSPTRSPAGTPALGASQDHTASFLPTSSFLPPAQFPWFGPSSAPVDWVRPGAAPFEPHTGDWHVFSGQADESYKRLTRTVDLTGATRGQLKFFTSYETESDWDYLFVEAHEVGSDDWTTLPDVNGHTDTDTGAQLPGGRSELHPFLAHYQTLQGDGARRRARPGPGTQPPGPRPARRSGRSTCPRTPASRSSCRSPTSPTGEPRGSACSSTTRRSRADGTTVADTSFETDLGGWTVAGPPEGSAANITDWARSQLAYEEGAVAVTARHGLHRLRARGSARRRPGRVRDPLDGAPARGRAKPPVIPVRPRLDV